MPSLVTLRLLCSPSASKHLTDAALSYVCRLYDPFPHPAEILSGTLRDRRWGARCEGRTHYDSKSTKMYESSVECVLAEA